MELDEKLGSQLVNRRQAHALITKFKRHSFEEDGTESESKREHSRGYSDAQKGIHKNPYNPHSPAHKAYEEGQQAYRRHFDESVDPQDQHKENHLAAVRAYHAKKKADKEQRSANSRGAFNNWMGGSPEDQTDFMNIRKKGVAEGSISDLLNQDPTSPKFNDHPGASQLKKAKGQNEFTGKLDSKGRFTKGTVKNMFGKLSPDAKGVAEGSLSEPTRKVFFKVIKTQGTGMPSGYRRVKTMRPLEDGGFYIELSTPGYGMDYTRHNYKNFSLKDDQGKPITGQEANNIINGKQGVAEGLEGQVVFSGTGANGAKYKVIHHGDDFMIHANGKHIDSYSSLQRAMSVLKNEVPGLTKGVAEGTEEFDEYAIANGFINQLHTDPYEKSEDWVYNRIEEYLSQENIPQQHWQEVAELIFRKLQGFTESRQDVAEGFNDTDTVFLTPNTGPLAHLRYNTFKDASPEEHKKAIQHHSKHADRATPQKAARAEVFAPSEGFVSAAPKVIP